MNEPVASLEHGIGRKAFEELAHRTRELVVECWYRRMYAVERSPDLVREPPIRWRADAGCRQPIRIVRTLHQAEVVWHQQRGVDEGRIGARAIIGVGTNRSRNRIV